MDPRDRIEREDRRAAELLTFLAVVFVVLLAQALPSLISFFI